MGKVIQNASLYNYAYWLSSECRWSRDPLEHRHIYWYHVGLLPNEISFWLWSSSNHFLLLTVVKHYSIRLIICHPNGAHCHALMLALISLAPIAVTRLANESRIICVITRNMCIYGQNKQYNIIFANLCKRNVKLLTQSMCIFFKINISQTSFVLKGDEFNTICSL